MSSHPTRSYFTDPLRGLVPAASRRHRALRRPDRLPVPPAGVPPPASPLPRIHAVVRARSRDGRRVRQSIVLSSPRALPCLICSLGIVGVHEARVYLGLPRLHRLPGSLLLGNVVRCNALVGMGREISGMGNHRCAQGSAIRRLQGTGRRGFRVHARHSLCCGRSSP